MSQARPSGAALPLSPLFPFPSPRRKGFRPMSYLKHALAALFLVSSVACSENPALAKGKSKPVATAQKKSAKKAKAKKHGKSKRQLTKAKKGKNKKKSVKRSLKKGGKKHAAHKRHGKKSA